MPPIPTQAIETSESQQIVHPKLASRIFAVELGCPFTHEEAKQLLGWEDEASYGARILKTNPKATKAMQEFGSDYLLMVGGKKIKTWHNCRNRPFDEGHARKLSQDILNGNFAPEGPNGENIIIGKYGSVISGQHRLVSLVLAYLEWIGPQKLHWQDKWKTPPTIDTYIAFGINESPRTIQTLDNVKPRALSDVFFTRPDLFGELHSAKRNQCCRMLDAAVDFLWKRTGAGSSKFEKYQTHSSSQDWLDRHPKLLECVKRIFDNMKDRVYAVLKLPEGLCSAMLYLMGCSASNVDDYSLADPAPNESVLDWSRWETACQFWADIAQKAQNVEPVAHALSMLVDEDGGSSGRVVEKAAIIAKGWLMYLDGKVEPYELDYQTDAQGQNHLKDAPTFDGIDLGPKLRVEVEPVEVQKSAAEERKKAEAAHLKALESKTPKAKGGLESIKEEFAKAQANLAKPAKKPPTPKKK